MSYAFDFRLILIFFAGIVSIALCIVDLKTGKTQSHWLTGRRLITRENNPKEYWLYIGLLFGLGIFALVAGILLFLVYYY